MRHMGYFAARDLIKTKLIDEAAKVGVNVRVLPAAGWKQALASLQPVPGIFIWHQADKVPTGNAATRDNGRRQVVDQVWSVVVGVKNVADVAGAAAQDDAEPLVNIVQTLQGWKPSAEHGHCYRIQSPFTSAYVNGFGVYPFAFQTRIFT